jgi:hypothetical protein
MLASYAVTKGRLARSIRSDQTVNLSGSHVEADPLQNLHAPKMLLSAWDFKHRFVGVDPGRRHFTHRPESSHGAKFTQLLCVRISSKIAQLFGSANALPMSATSGRSGSLQ